MKSAAGPCSRNHSAVEGERANVDASYRFHSQDEAKKVQDPEEENRKEEGWLLVKKRKGGRSVGTTYNLLIIVLERNSE